MDGNLPRAGRDLRRQAILNVACEAFLAEGYAAVSMSAIAATLGGSKATLYAYFRSKAELFAAVMED
ncbi:MAG: helix-turn-helix domain-containing protein, partial [Caulobacteraceae bacterium]